MQNLWIFLQIKYRVGVLKPRMIRVESHLLASRAKWSRSELQLEALRFKRQKSPDYLKQTTSAKVLIEAIMPYLQGVVRQ